MAKAPAAPSIRDALEAAYQKQAGPGGAPGGAPPDGDGDQDQPGGPVPRDAFSYQEQAPDPSATCGNCEFFDGKATCGLYDEANGKMPDVFSLDPSTTPQAWCQAHVGGDQGGAAQGAPAAAPAPAPAPGAPAAPAAPAGAPSGY